jgi:Ubiquinol-cytochrome C reductase, UQCRX/QCR9 like
MSGLLYRTIFQRNATFWASILTTAFFAEIAMDSGVDAVFDRINKGVSSELCLSFSSIFIETMERHSRPIRCLLISLFYH